MGPRAGDELSSNAKTSAKENLQGEPAARATQVGSIVITNRKTLDRYTTHVYKFLDFLVSLGAAYPSNFMQLDEFVCLYIDHLWESGDSTCWASDCLSGLCRLAMQWRLCCLRKVALRSML